MSDIQILFPEPVPVTVGGRQVLILPVRMRHFEAFGQAASDLFVMLGKFTSEEIYSYAKKNGGLKVILLHCTTLSRWRLSRLPAAVAVELMIHVVMANAGFFGRALVKAERFVVGQTSPSN